MDPCDRNSLIIMNRLITLLLAASCLTAVGQVPDYVPTEGLVVWWNSGYSGITETSGAIPTAGRWGLEGEAMFFDGQDDFVLLNNLTLPQGDDQRTTSRWFNQSAFIVDCGFEQFGTLVNYGPASSNERWFMLVRDNFLQIGAHNDDICRFATVQVVKALKLRKTGRKLVCSNGITPSLPSTGRCCRVSSTGN